MRTFTPYLSTFLACSILVVALMYANTGSAQTQEHGSVEGDRQALIALYNATDGDNWTSNTNWLSSEPMGAWSGITTRRSDGRVTSLRRSNAGLRGTIPRELGKLTEIEELDFSGNHLKGILPPELGNQTKLRSLDIRKNNLSGEIPRSFGRLALRSFKFDFNDGLCARTDAESLRWLQGIRSLSGLGCDGEPLYLLPGVALEVDENFINIPGNRTYYRDQTVEVELEFESEDVELTVDTSGGLPTIDIEVAGQVRKAHYSVLASTTSRLVFHYTVQAEDYYDGTIWILRGSLLVPNGSSIMNRRGDKEELSWSSGGKRGTGALVNGRRGPPPTLTPTPTHIPIPTLTPTPTHIPIPTWTPVSSQTRALADSPTRTSTPFPTQSPTYTPTPIQTQTATLTPTNTQTAIPPGVAQVVQAAMAPPVVLTPTPAYTMTVIPTPTKARVGVIAFVNNQTLLNGLFVIVSIIAIGGAVFAVYSKFSPPVRDFLKGLRRERH